jgi:hypothetical protein
MEKAIKNKVSKAVVPAIDVMFQALRFVSNISWLQRTDSFIRPIVSAVLFSLLIVNLEPKLCPQRGF